MLDIERELLNRTWFPVARLADLENGVARGNILGVELVVYRVGDEVTVASAFCPHRGAALHMGDIDEGGLRCPYHGWLFAPGDGRCAHVPSLPAGSTPPRTSLTVYPVDVAYGLVWSCLGEPLFPRPGLPTAVDADWAVAAGTPFRVRCGMRQLTENFRDKAHFPFVHADSMGTVSKVVEPYRVERDGWQLTWSASVGPEFAGPEGPVEDDTYRLDYHITLPMFASIRVTAPSGGRRFVAQLATPVTADGGEVAQFWLAGLDPVSLAQGADIEDALDYERQIFVEDHPVVENQHLREAPLDLHGQVHTPADKFSIVFRRTYRELLDLIGPPAGERELPVRRGSTG
ncbi:Rieske 2Fe-2S domain-containing protein [Saccharothrix sp. HUAS TT1]|uniref:Rieske 2Fe-2S domain-containing protein n=1 Tax=unclassified Saccharothrix TaxID=2593673 RepID=UPI00345BF565